MTPLLVNGPANAIATVVLAHGAGAGMEHDFMVTVAEGMAQRGLRVVRFEFPYMHARREGRRPGPDRMPKLQECFREVIDSQTGPVILSGKSMGGRIATTIADEVDAHAVIVFGYPFHPPGKPERPRTEHLENLRTPTLIIQGERDTFGTQADVADYKLSKQIGMSWLHDADHSLKPRKISGLTHEEHLASAIDQAATFAEKHVRHAD